MLRSILAFFILHSSFLISKAQPLPPLVDAVYDPQLKTVVLYPAVGGQIGSPAETLNPPVIALNDATPLVLEFDDLTAQYRGFRLKFIHCDANWQRSVLNDIEFTFEANDYPITQYQNSLGTKVPYYHYQFALPRLKVSGNYVLAVIDERNPRNILFTRRFRVYENRLNVAMGVRPAQDPQRQFTDQQIDLAISYQNYPVISPQDDFRVQIRQNYRDDRVLSFPRPTNVDMMSQTLTYQPADLSNTFPGGNEYRFFDLRTLLSRANFVARIDRQPDRTLALAQPDAPRNGLAYTQFDDFNGRYVIDNRDLTNSTGATSADYVQVTFTLRIAEQPGAELHVNGQFNDWLLNDRTRMTYNVAAGAYQATILLKQGVYNYNYAIRGPGLAAPERRFMTPTPGNEALLDGDFAAAENDYEVFVYHRPPAARADQLVAYRKVGINKRR